MMQLFKKFCAEFIGTFVLVLFACGTATVLGCSDKPSGAYILTAIAFGLVIVAMAYSIGNVSGCHINPAVSFGVLLNGGMNIKEFCVYLIAQFTGATAGATVLGMLAGFNSSLGTNGLYKGVSWKYSLLAETILTFVFVLVILCVTSQKKYEKCAGLVIGFTLTLVHIFGIYFTGTSVNPARSFGPALIKAFAGDSTALSCYWVFLVAPLLGAAIAAIVYRFILNTDYKKEA